MKRAFPCQNLATKSIFLAIALIPLGAIAITAACVAGVLILSTPATAAKAKAKQSTENQNSETLASQDPNNPSAQETAFTPTQQPIPASEQKADTVTTEEIAPGPTIESEQSGPRPLSPVERSSAKHRKATLPESKESTESAPVAPGTALSPNIQYMCNTYSKKFHILDCQFAEQMKIRHRYPVENQKAARELGCKPCKWCLPRRSRTVRAKLLTPLQPLKNPKKLDAVIEEPRRESKSVKPAVPNGIPSPDIGIQPSPDIGIQPSP